MQEHRPGRVFRRNGRAVRAASPGDRAQVGGLGERHRGVLDRLPTPECARQRVGRHRGVVAGNQLHVCRIVDLRGEHHVGGGIKDAAHQLIQISVNLLCRIRRRRLRGQGEPACRQYEGRVRTGPVHAPRLGGQVCRRKNVRGRNTTSIARFLELFSLPTDILAGGRRSSASIRDEIEPFWVPLTP